MIDAYVVEVYYSDLPSHTGGSRFDSCSTVSLWARYHICSYMFHLNQVHVIGGDAAVLINRALRMNNIETHCHH